MRATCLAVMLLFMATAAAAQNTSGGSSEAKGRPWIVIGGATATVLGDCAACEEDSGQYRQAGAFLANGGISLNDRADIGGELVFIPSNTRTGEEIHTTFVMAAGQFRFWRNKGFFVKAAAGMGFVKNWVVDLSGTGADPSPPFTSKALALGLAAGWEWRLSPRLGVQVFGTHHVASLGDLEANQTRFENVVGNYWLVGGGIVIR